jgi:hypothetical protein
MFRQSFLALLLAWTSLAQIYLPFDTVYSVHTNDAQSCPPDYLADSKYIGCCHMYDYLTTATGPAHTAVPACCKSNAVSGCTGAPVAMYDWSLTTDTILGESK